MTVDHSTIRRKNVNEGYKMLGVRFILSGKHIYEYKHRKEQSQRMVKMLYRALATT